MGGKGNDTDAVPLCAKCHALEHAGHKSFWGDIDVKKIIKDLQGRYNQ